MALPGRAFLRRCLKPDVIILTVDSPQEAQEYAAWLDVSGWALSVNGFRMAVQIKVNGTVIRSLRADQPSPSLAKSFRHVPFNATSGFSTRIRREELPDDRAALIEVVAYPQHSHPAYGASQHRAIRVERASIGTVLHNRVDYQTTWDDAAATLDEARVAVAGSIDLDTYRESGQTTADDIAREVGLQPSDRVLEIGCGTGRVGRWLAERCATWTGTDVSRRMIDHATEAVAGFRNVSFVLLNGYDLSGVDDESQHVVYSSAVFCHLDEWDRYRYVKEAYRVLRPGGRIWFDNINLLSEVGWDIFEELSKYEPAGRPPRISKTSTPDELECYAKRVGFVDVRVRPSGVFVAVFGRKTDD